MVFVTLFPETENIHLIKDVGMIPYIMHKHYNFNSKIVCYKNGEYTYLNKDVKGLNIDFMKRYTNNIVIDGLIYLLKNARKIDVLHLFHMTSKRNYYWIFLYKLLNPKGKVYLKLDANDSIKHLNFSNKRLKSLIKVHILKKCKVISGETQDIVNYINENWPITVSYIPNGFYDEGRRELVDYSKKKNIICTVGRIGTKVKGTDILLKAFKIAADYIPNWKLKIVGPIDSEFKSYINSFFKENPKLIDRVIFTGGIYDRKDLEKEYRTSKIFCLTSRSESFGIVFVEAIKAGCFILSSKVGAALDVTDNKKFGDIFDVGNSQQMAELMIKYCNREDIFQRLYKEIQDFAYDKFYWVKICQELYKQLNKNI